MVHKYLKINPVKSLICSFALLWESAHWLQSDDIILKVNGYAFSERCCAVWKFLLEDYFVNFWVSVMALKDHLFWIYRHQFWGEKKGKTKMVKCICSSAASAGNLSAYITSGAGLMLSSQTSLVSFVLLLTLLLGKIRLGVTNILSCCTAWPGPCLVLTLEKIIWEQNRVNKFCTKTCC